MTEESMNGDNGETIKAPPPAPIGETPEGPSVPVEPGPETSEHAALGTTMQRGSTSEELNEQLGLHTQKEPGHPVEAELTEDQIKEVLLDRLTELPEVQARLQAIESSDLSQEEKDEQIRQVIEELTEREQENPTPESDENLSEDEKAAREQRRATARQLLEEGNAALNDKSPEGEANRETWLKSIWKNLGSDEARELYKALGMILFLQLISLIFKMVSLHFGKADKRG